MFDTDSEDMSLAVMRKLVNEVSLLKSVFDGYKKLEIHLPEVDPWEPKDVSVLGHDTKEVRDERMRSLEKRERAEYFVGECYKYTGGGGLVSLTKQLVDQAAKNNC